MEKLLQIKTQGAKTGPGLDLIIVYKGQMHIFEYEFDCNEDANDVVDTVNKYINRIVND